MNTIARQIFRPTIALIAMMSIVTQSLFTEDNSALTIHEREIYDLIMTNDPGDIWRTSYANPEAMRTRAKNLLTLLRAWKKQL